MSKKINFNQTSQQALDLISTIEKARQDIAYFKAQFNTNCATAFEESAGVLEVESPTIDDIRKALESYDYDAESVLILKDAVAWYDTAKSQLEADVKPRQERERKAIDTLVSNRMYSAYLKAIGEQNYSGTGAQALKGAFVGWFMSLGYEVPQMTDYALEKSLDIMGYRACGVTTSGKAKSRLTFKRTLYNELINGLVNVKKVLTIDESGKASNVYCA